MPKPSQNPPKIASKPSINLQGHLHDVIKQPSPVTMQAMNRSLANVILGGYGVSKGPAMEVEGSHTETDSASVIDMLTGAKDVIIVPGSAARSDPLQRSSL